MPPTRRTFITAAGVAAVGTAMATTSGTGGSAHAAPGDDLSYPLHLPEMPLHDPYIVTDESSGHYFLYTSNVASMSGEDVTGTMVYRSRNLRDWTEPVVVFRVQDGMWATNGAWAPEVHEGDGNYYLFTTLHNEDKIIPVPPPNQYGIPVQVKNYMRDHRGTAPAG